MSTNGSVMMSVEGVIKEEVFKIEMEFTGYATEYVAERIWSPDQELIKKKDGTAKPKFSASSEPELISWVLSFGDEAKVVKPNWLIDKIKQIVISIQSEYSD